MQLKNRLLDAARWAIDAGNFQKRRVLTEELDQCDIGYALDMGCGLGVWNDLFLHGGCYLGIDADEDAIKYAQKKHGHKHPFKVMDATNLKLFDKSFTMVLICDLFHHLDDESVKKAFAEAKRVLKDRGPLFPNAGKIVVIDSVKSKNPLQRLVMSFDSGKHIRTSKELGELLQLQAKKEFNSGLYREVVFVYER
jgi:ubiquinone/menaquinone biosynthesis C-methylase UbiE